MKTNTIRIPIIIALSLLFNCGVAYIVHIKTIPEGDYDIYFDKKQYGVMPPKGDTTIQFPKVSSLKTPVLEVKSTDHYGCFQFGLFDSTRKMKKVKSHRIKGNLVKKCDIVFDLNAPDEKRLTVPVTTRYRDKPLTVEEFQRLASSPIHYCVADLQVLQKGMKSYDAANADYKIMKQYVDLNIQRDGYSWDTVDADLTRRITLGLADDTTNNPDSLPYAAWDLASSQKIKYIVVFYGYSQLESRGVAPGTAAASVALTALGIFAGAATGFYTVVYPTGKDRKSVMDSYCAIFSVDSNRCLFNTKASIISFNNTIEVQIGDLYKKLFASINIFLHPKQK